MAWRRDLFLNLLEQTRRRYQFVVVDYVVIDGWPGSTPSEFSHEGCPGSRGFRDPGLIVDTER
jgi:hypothetical protein